MAGQEAADEAKREAKRQKAAEKRQRELAAAAGSNGQVAALDGVRFSGTFGVSFAQEPKMTKQGLRNARKEGALMETEDDEEARGQMSVESARKKAGFEVARRNYLIKKSKKMAKQKEKRELKSGKKQVLKLGGKSLKA
jgi:hypothetical protein